MKLYFLRHGLAGDPDQWQGDDALRPLTEEGKERMAREAAALSRLSLEIDKIVTSPLVRAYQTAEIFAQGCNMMDRLVKDERIAPGFDSKQLDKVLADYAGANALMFVGHEPDFSELIGELIGGGRVVCKKGGLALVDLPHPDKLKGKLVWLIPPSVLAP